MMKFLFPLFPLLLAPCFAESPELPMLVFLNGDTLQGQAVAVDPAKLSWNSKTLGAKSDFFTSQIRELVLPEAIAAKSSTDHISYVRFNPDLRQQNQKLAGDTLYGSLVDVTDTSIILDTWYAGRLTLDRNMVRSLEIKDMLPPLYSGPNAEADWTASPPLSWLQEDRKLHIKQSNGIMGRSFKEMPDTFCLSFLVEWQGHLSLQLSFCAKEMGERTSTDGYIMHMDSSHCQLQRRTLGMQPQFLNQAGMMGDDGPDTSTLREKEKSLFQLFVDRNTGKIVLYSDETLIHEWQDVSPKAKGNVVQFTTYSGRSNGTTISRISMTKWNGIVLDKDNAKVDPISNPEPAEGEQRIVLSNGDIALGSVEKIADGNVYLKTRFGELQLPVSRIKNLKLTPPEYNERLLQNGDVRGWYPDGSHVTFRLDSITAEGKWKGYGQHFGDAEFDTEAFSRIEFNLYPPMLKDF